jgi:hypothetical protein
MQRHKQYLLDPCGGSTHSAQMPWAKTIHNFIFEAEWVSRGATLDQGIVQASQYRCTRAGLMMYSCELTAPAAGHLRYVGVYQQDRLLRPPHKRFLCENQT